MMHQQGNEHQLIFSYLRSLNFHFLETWVIECVNFYKSNHPNISLSELKNEVKQQWLLANLREIKVPSLPPDLKSKTKIILNGAYAVQVESMIDSSKSCFSQLHKLLKINFENIEATEKPEKERPISSNRCLTFVISDGVQEIQAMEYQPIKKIKTCDPNLLPGFKMVILGPVECRKGMILLKDENVQICGGEVGTLAVTNRLENILIRKLGFDESDYLNLLGNKNENKYQKPPSNEQVIEEYCLESLLSQNDDLFLSIPLENEIVAQEQQQPAESVKSYQSSVREIESPFENIVFDEDPELIENPESSTVNKKKHCLPEEEMQMPEKKKLSLDPEVTNEIVYLGSNSSFHQNSLQINDENKFVDDFYESQSITVAVSSKTTKPVQTKLSSYFKTSIGNNAKMSTDKQISFYVSDKPFIYLKHVMSLKLKRATVFKIKAVILTLKKKITIEKDKFNLKVSITDGLSCIDVDICSQILEEFLGFSPCEMSVMLKAKQTNSAIAERIKESFSKTQDKLIHLNCLMNIKFFTESKCPLILSLEEVTERHLNELKERSL